MSTNNTALRASSSHQLVAPGRPLCSRPARPSQCTRRSCRPFNSLRVQPATRAARSHARISQVFGTPVRAPAPSHKAPTAGRYISACVTRRGNRVIFCAALADTAEPSLEAVQKLLAEPADGNQELKVGHLDNGLRYVIMPNPTPPARFEAHLELHVGSVDEREHEQGVAHLVEHVTFIGSKRREMLLGTGARANAYTDFHHTVFHVHAPLENSKTKDPMLPQVLEALADIAFEPEFLPSRLEKERKAVLAEAQMMNTMEYRVDCQLLLHLHAENNLGWRFPIGKTDQVKTWPHELVKSFWERWYFPGNATLYVVGDLAMSTQQVEALIEETFGEYDVARLGEPGRPANVDLTIDVTSTSQEGLTHLVTSSTSSSGSDSDTASASSSSHHSNGNGAATNGNGVASNGAAAAAAVASPQASPGDDPDADVGPLVPPDQHVPVAVDAEGVKVRHLVRPPVVHAFGCGPLRPEEGPARVNVFRHPLLQMFQLTVFCKLPMVPLEKLDALHYNCMVRMLVAVFQFRVNQRYNRGEPRFVGIELDISDSGREGCCVATLTVTAEPGDWEGAVQVAVQEARRLQRYGLTPGELERYKLAMLRDSAQLAAQGASVPHIHTLDFVMESMAIGSTVMSHKEAHDAMERVLPIISLEDINAVARSLLCFAAEYGREGEVLEQAAAAEHGQYAGPGPTRATAIVACVPAYVDASGHSKAGAGPIPRAALGASGHLDADAIDLEELERQSAALDEAGLDEVPPGGMRFELTHQQIGAALASPDIDITQPRDVPLPPWMVPPERLQQLLASMQPRYVALDGSAGGEVFPPPTPDFGVVQRRLSNGIRVNYRRTDNEPRAGMLRLVASGGRYADPITPGPAGVASSSVGARTLTESGAMGRWDRQEVEVYCIINLASTVFDCSEEFLVMDTRYTLTDGGLRCAFELVHEFVAASRWEEAAFDRAKQALLTSARSTGKSLERETSERIMAALLGPDRRLLDPSPEALEALTLEGVRGAVRQQLRPDNLELDVVGDFDPEELEALILQYIGTLTPDQQYGQPATNGSSSAIVDVTPTNGSSTPSTPSTSSSSSGDANVVLQCEPLSFVAPPPEQRRQTWHLDDSDERACAYIVGPAPCRWGPYGTRDPLPPLSGPVEPPVRLAPGATKEQVAEAAAVRRRHPLYATCSLQLLSEVINGRLFTTVRDSLGLTYDVSFEVTQFDIIRNGWYSVNVTSYPDKIHEALAASLSVLRELAVNPVNAWELMRAKNTVITRHESDLKDNAYVLGLITHLQNPNVPLKNAECLRDLVPLYELLTIEDIITAYNQLGLGDDQVLTCIGTSGAEAPPEPTPEQFGKMYQNARMLGALGALGGMGWDMKRPQQPQAVQPVQQQQQPQLVGQGGGAAGGQKDQLSVFAAALMAAQASKLTQAFQFLGDIAKGQQQEEAGRQQQQQQQQQQAGQGQAPPPQQQQQKQR